MTKMGVSGKIVGIKSQDGFYMYVIAHGNVDQYCADRGWAVAGRYDGALVEIKNIIPPVVVTDEALDKNEYYYLKYLLLKRGVELISVWFEPSETTDFLVYLNQRERDRSRRGRLPFGFMVKNGEVVENPETISVARRIVALRDAGCTYKQIQDDDLVRYPDGRKMSISTIQVILKNRNKY